MRTFHTYSDKNVETVEGIENAQNYIIEEIDAIQCGVSGEEDRERLNALGLMLDDLFCEVNEKLEQ